MNKPTNERCLESHNFLNDWDWSYSICCIGMWISPNLSPTRFPVITSTLLSLTIVTLIDFLLFFNIAEDNLSQRFPLLSPSEVSGRSRGVGGIRERNGKLTWWMPSSVWFPLTGPSQSWQTKNGGSRISSHGLEQGARVTATEEFWSRTLSSSFLHRNFYKPSFGDDRGLLSHHWDKISWRGFVNPYFVIQQTDLFHCISEFSFSFCSRYWSSLTFKLLQTRPNYFNILSLSCCLRERDIYS